MTRKKAVLWGAILGGFVGPLLGGILLALIDPLSSGNPLTLRSLLGTPAAAVVYFSLPGLVIGSALGLILRRIRAPFRAMLGAIAALLTYAALFLSLGITSRGMMWFYVNGIVGTPLSLWFSLALPGAVCGLLFPTPRLSIQPS